MLSRSFGSSRRKLRRSGMLAACTMGGTVTLMLCYLSVSGLVVIFVVLAYYCCWTTNSTAVPELQLQLHCTAHALTAQHAPSLTPSPLGSLTPNIQLHSIQQSVRPSVGQPRPPRLVKLLVLLLPIRFSPNCCPSSAQLTSLSSIPCVLRLCALHSIHSLSSLALPALSALPCCCSFLEPESCPARPSMCRKSP